MSGRLSRGAGRSSYLQSISQRYHRQDSGYNQQELYCQVSETIQGDILFLIQIPNVVIDQESEDCTEAEDLQRLASQSAQDIVRSDRM